MNKLVPFKKFSKKASLVPSGASVVMDEKNIPLGFVFGRDAFITFLEALDNEFEKNIPNPKIAYNNPAGKLIDLIEERLPLNPKFVKDLKESISKSKKSRTYSLEEVMRSLNV